MQSFHNSHGLPGDEPGSQFPPLLKVQQVAFLLNTSVRSVWKLDTKGTMPAPVKVKGTRWVRDEILDWIADGLPDLTGDRFRYRRRRRAS